VETGQNGLGETVGQWQTVAVGLCCFAMESAGEVQAAGGTTPVQRAVVIFRWTSKLAATRAADRVQVGDGQVWIVDGLPEVTRRSVKLRLTALRAIGGGADA
jgi:hypothetical protein